MIRFKYLCTQKNKNRLEMNRKKTFTVFLLLLIFSYAKGQDKIVTTQGDTIFCKIVSISLEFIKYEQKDLNQTPVNYSVPMRQVQEYSLGPRSEESAQTPFNRTPNAKPLPAPLKKKQEQPIPYTPPSNKKQVTDPFSPASYHTKETESFYRWRIGIQGGGSYLINSLAHSRQAMKDLGVVPDIQANDYYYKLRNGLSAGADIYYLLNRTLGVGVKYSGFTSSVQMNYTVKDNNAAIPTYYSAGEKEKLYLNYVGPSFLLQQWLGSSHQFRLNEELSVGYIFFRDQIQFDPYQYVFVSPVTNQKQYNVLKKGSTYSGIFQLSFEYYPAPYISLGLSAAGVPVMFRSLNVSDNNGSNYEETLGKSHSLDLTRVDGSLSVRFHF